MFRFYHLRVKADLLHQEISKRLQASTRDPEDLVLLDCKVGSRDVAVACPKCQSVSFETLYDPYSPDYAAKLLLPHICSYCGTVSRYCVHDPENLKKWGDLLRHYKSWMGLE